jgi:hypothetical protein
MVGSLTVAVTVNVTVPKRGSKSSALTIRDRLRHRENGRRHSIEPTIMDAHEIVAMIAPSTATPDGAAGDPQAVRDQGQSLWFGLVHWPAVASSRFPSQAKQY